jgi:DNA polymerase-1
MPLIPTHDWKPGAYGPSEDEQIYNALDTMVTLEVHEELQPLFNSRPDVYNFAIALQAPALEMMQRGFLIDQFERRRAIDDLSGRIERLYDSLGELANAVWDRPLNPNSQKQLQEFFYGRMGIPEIWITQKGQRKLSMNREVLEKLHLYYLPRPIINHILAIRDLSKQLSVIQTEIDPDGRMRTSYNVAGTETGRWSSSANAFGTGTNLQNLDRQVRRMFVADPGWKLCGIDLEQAESREVAWQMWVLFGDTSYMDACLSGDLHTTVARLAYPHLPWTGDIKKDRAIAEGPFYRVYTYRDMAKKLGHGSNYYGKPPMMARHAKIPVEAAALFQTNYFGAFPLQKWHTWTAGQIQQLNPLVTPFGRRRHFFGRPNDDTTLREAIAYTPQSSTGDRLNLALWRVWYHMGDRVRVIAQVHDALYFLYRESDNEEEVVSQALSYIDTPFHHNGRTLSVPGEAKVGWNWGDFNDDPKRGRVNPEGLQKFKGKDKRTRRTGLDRIM